MIKINPLSEQLPIDLVKQLQKIEVATISHFADECVSAELFQINYQNSRFAGTAVTVSIETEDAAILHYALDLLRPHDVLVININFDTIRSCWGLIMHMAASNKLVNGVIINGNITDIYSLRNHGIPIAYKNITAKIFRSHPGLSGGFNVPVSVGGLIINPGDAVLVDECGIASISPIKLKEIIIQGLEIQSKEPALIYSLLENNIGDLSGSKSKITKTLCSQSDIKEKQL